jgi:broad specificity polyphosphatase/5'/3'-nucleotidase SurE
MRRSTSRTKGSDETSYNVYFATLDTGQRTINDTTAIGEFYTQYIHISPTQLHMHYYLRGLHRF